MIKHLVLTLMAVGLYGCSSPKPPAQTETPKNTTPTFEPQKESNKTAQIVKFFDYACGYCRTAHFTVEELKTEFGEKITVELKHFPLSAETYIVAETAECARRQNKFKVYHNELIENNFRQYTPENLQKVAQIVGLNLKEFNTCVANGGGKSAVQTHVDQATSMGIRSTPYFVINDSIPVTGSVPAKSFSRLIKQILDGEVQ